VLVAIGGLPSLVVTLGTLALFRGLALVVLGEKGVSKFPDWFTTFGFSTIGGSPIPYSLVVFAIIAVALGLVLHRTWIGRQVFAIGKNKDAARYSGVRVQRVKLLLFVLSGTIAALAGVIITARFASARADIGTGLTLTVVTMVLLGGVNINGGKGTIPGVVIAVFVLAVLGNVLRLARVSAEWQSIVVGLLLIVSVVIPYIAHQVSVVIERSRGARRPPDRTLEPGEVSQA
jgi:rhamnose transport system permease protein